MTDRLSLLIDFFRQHWVIASLLLGAISAFGFPPFHGWFLGLGALSLFIVLLRTASGTRVAFMQGWLFGWAHLTLANNWIATAFTHQAKMPEFLGWIAVPLLCIYLAIYPALAAAIAHAVARKSGPMAFGTILAGAWIVTEWVRSWAFTGYPWPPLGLMLLGGWDSQGLAILLPWLGTYALSGLAILLAASFASLAMRAEGIGGWSAFSGLAIAVTAVMLTPSDWFTAERNSTLGYTLVQPLIPQDEINDPAKFEEQFQRIASLTAEGRERSRLVLWPESAIPDYFEEGYPQRYYNRTTWNADPREARNRIATIIGPQSTLLTGAINLNIGELGGRARAVSARNSVVALDGGGTVTHEYAKAHLVPYGEYLPLEEWLGAIGLARLTAGTIPYLPGPGPRTLDLSQHGRAGIQICYEIVFSGQVVDRSNRPDYLFNPSNDGWFGHWGPPQHLAQARMRAIEEGLPVLRSTTTGISAVIDANGVVREAIASGLADKVDGNVPAANPPTLFSQIGNLLGLLWALVLFVLGAGIPRLLAHRASRS